MAANKLTADEAIELRYFWALGAKPTALSRAYHISPEAAYAHTTYRQKREVYRKAYYASESEHVKVQRREWQMSPKGKLSKRKDALKRAYGITLEQYDTLLAYQNGRCAICSTPASEFLKGLGLDHNHVTGKNRGLLCTNCNSRLVAALEDPLLPKAQAYLARYQ